MAQHLGSDVGHEGKDLLPVAPHLVAPGETLGGVGRCLVAIARGEATLQGVDVVAADRSGKPIQRRRNVEPASGCLLELTAQQREIVRLAARGLTNSEIAHRLFLSPRTVASHLYRSYPKLGIAGRHQLPDLIAKAGEAAPSERGANEE
jgi:DNA-binding CsgD family transcriptional regulator